MIGHGDGDGGNSLGGDGEGGNSLGGDGGNSLSGLDGIYDGGVETSRLNFIRVAVAEWSK